MVLPSRSPVCLALKAGYLLLYSGKLAQSFLEASLLLFLFTVCLFFSSSLVYVRLLIHPVHLPVFAPFFVLSQVSFCALLFCFFTIVSACLSPKRLGSLLGRSVRYRLSFLFLSYYTLFVRLGSLSSYFGFHIVLNLCRCIFAPFLHCVVSFLVFCFLCISIFLFPSIPSPAFPHLFEISFHQSLLLKGTEKEGK